MNAIFLHGIAGLLGLKTRIVSDAGVPDARRQDRTAACDRQAAGADRYLSGPSAKEYFDEAMFLSAGITPEWMSYGTIRNTRSFMALSSTRLPCSICFSMLALRLGAMLYLPKS